MSVIVGIPATIQSALKMPATVTVNHGTIRQILDELNGIWPVIKPRLQTETGEVHRFVNIYLGDTDIRQLQGLNTVAKGNDVVTILSAVSGG